MKKFITVIALFLSFSAFADNNIKEGPTFGEWITAHIVEGSWMTSYIYPEGTTVSQISLSVYSSGNVTISYLYRNRSGDGYGQLVSRSHEIVQVNGQPVKFSREYYSTGHMTFEPLTLAGKKFVREEILNKSQILFKGPEWGVTFSGKGSRKAWNSINYYKAI